MVTMDADIRRLYHQYFDMLEGGVLVILADGSERIVFASERAARLYECASEEEFLDFCGASYQNIVSANDYIPLSEMAEGREKHFHLLFHYWTKGKHYHKAQGPGKVQKMPFGRVYLIQLFSSEQIADDLKSDGYTDLPGMHDFYRQAQQFIQEKSTERGRKRYCPVVFDITRFREYNRLHGVHAGDRCLKRIAAMIAGQFPGELVGHLAADRFIALLPDDALEEKLEHLCNEINHYIDDDGILIKTGLFRSETDLRPDEIRHAFDSAKVACDSIKLDGNRLVAVYVPSMGEYLEKKMYILRHFSEALEKKYIKVFFQPVIRTITGNLCGFEALARWEDPLMGMLSPGLFVPVLEEEQLINRLDRYIIDRVLRLLRDRIDNGLPLLPVSMNLSGYDFEVDDPYQEIERLVSKYNVPRNVLCFEITERVMARNNIGLASTIQRFQKAGYQVWMDDFGSEYSSLNSLHSYHFNVIKIDMGFFSHFDFRSRQIITSVMMMAKMLGVQTLAEGVETEEQVSFLRQIGCGRIQGYFYGRPAQYEDAMDYIRERHLLFEEPRWRRLLDASESVNLMTDSPTALFSFNGRDIALLAENDAYCRELRSTGTQGREEANLNLHAMEYPLRNKFIQLLSKAMDSKAEETLVYVDNGQYMKVSARWIAGDEALWVGEARVYNISTKAEFREVSLLDDLLRNLYPLYDGIYLMDRGRDEIRILQCNHPNVHEGEVFHPMMPSFASYTRKMVYPDDQERFLSFIQPKHLEAGCRGTASGSTSDLFRVRREDGTYRWTLLEGLVIYKSRTKNILLCESQSIWETKADRDMLLPIFAKSFGFSTKKGTGEAEPDDSNLFRAIKARSPYPFYWKDQDGRVQGMSAAFLELSGVRDESVILGRTEEEIGWQANPSAAQDAEDKVLGKKEIIEQTEEHIMTGGQCRDVMITRTPWYRGKQMAGMLGLISGGYGEAAKKRLGITDSETGLLSYRGAIEAGLVYADQYRTHRTDYAGILIDIPGFADVLNEDEGKAAELLKGVVRMLTETFSAGWAIARIELACFLCFCRRDKASKIDEALDRIAEEIRSLRLKLGIQSVPILTKTAAFGSEVDNLDELLQLLFRRLNNSEKEVYGDHPYIGDRIILNREAFDDIPESVIISDPETYEMIYLNKAARHYLGLQPDTRINGCLCYQLIEKQSAPCKNCPNILLRRDRIYVSKRMLRETGGNRLLRTCLIPAEGRSLRLSVAFNVDDYVNSLAKDHELIYQEMQANDAISAGISEADPDRGIKRMMEYISRNLQPERFLIFEERDDNTVSATYEWTAQGVVPLMDELQSLPRSGMRALYREFDRHHVVLVSDMEVFQREHPDFNLRITGVERFVSGQLTLPDKTEGFTMVVNPSADTFRLASLLLSTLTDFIAAMIRNRNSIRQLEWQSTRDQLTGIGNRWALEKKIREWRGDGILGVISVDLNGLKYINDTEGHHAGDMLICETGKILRECVAADSVFRTGGDEFVVVTENIEEQELQRLIQQIRDSARRNGISMAIGYAISKGLVRDFDGLLTQADFEMYQDKKHSFHRRRDDR